MILPKFPSVVFRISATFFFNRPVTIENRRNSVLHRNLNCVNIPNHGFDHIQRYAQGLLTTGKTLRSCIRRAWRSNLVSNDICKLSRWFQIPVRRTGSRMRVLVTGGSSSPDVGHLEFRIDVNIILFTCRGTQIFFMAGLFM